MLQAHDEKEGDDWLLRLAGLGGIALLLNLVLLVFVLWKENPLFWRNEGGYPVWLRELVLATFYPLLFVQFAVMSLLSMWQFSALPVEKAIRLGALLAVVILWLLLGIVLAILSWNNLDNLFNGRDLHDPRGQHFTL